MSTERRPIRLGLAAPDAARSWEEGSGPILDPDKEDDVRLEKVGDLAWTWEIGEVESGRIEFRDAGPEQAAAEIEVSRPDGSAGNRAGSIVDRLADELSGPGLDPPVVARDPHQGEPPEASTDPDQPL